MHTQIKNIIFDFGGVLFTIDHSLTKKAFEKIGVKNFGEIYGHFSQTDLFDRMEKGEISDPGFLNELKKNCPPGTSLQEIEDAWNALLVKLREETVPMLKALNKNYRIFLLSNTNSIHLRNFSANIDKEFGMKNFIALFEKVYFSHETGMRKPNANIFQKVIDENKLIPSETLFLDDSKQHIAGARSVGLSAELVDAGIPLRETLVQAGIV